MYACVCFCACVRQKWMCVCMCMAAGDSGNEIIRKINSKLLIIVKAIHQTPRKNYYKAKNRISKRNST